MAKYKLSNLSGPGGSIVRDDGACIPRDEGNFDYREYLVWLAQGNTPDAADPIPVPRKSLARRVADLIKNDRIAGRLGLTAAELQQLEGD